MLGASTFFTGTTSVRRLVSPQRGAHLVGWRSRSH
jgi:hypothetical protein